MVFRYCVPRGRLHVEECRRGGRAWIFPSPTTPGRFFVIRVARRGDPEERLVHVRLVMVRIRNRRCKIETIHATIP